MTLNFPAMPPLPDLADGANYNQRVLDMFTHIGITMVQYMEGLSAEDFFQVQADPLDQTAGKLLKVGSFGLNASIAIPSNDVNLAIVGAKYHGYGGAHSNPTGGDNPFPSLNGAFFLEVGNLGIGGAGEYLTQTAIAIGGSNPGQRRTRIINITANGFTDWFEDYSSAKEPDVFGSNSNGNFLKMVDGTLLMWRDRIAVGISGTTSTVWTGVFPTSYVGSIGIIPMGSGGNSAENNYGSYLATARISSSAPEIHLRHIHDTALTDTLYCGYIAIARWK